MPCALISNVSRLSARGVKQAHLNSLKDRHYGDGSQICLHLFLGGAMAEWLFFMATLDFFLCKTHLRSMIKLTNPNLLFRSIIDFFLRGRRGLFDDDLFSDAEEAFRDIFCRLNKFFFILQ